MVDVERNRRYTRRATVLLLGAAVASTALWVLVSKSSLYDPIAELPQIAAVTCALSAASLYATFRTGAVAQRRTGKRGSTDSWPSTVAAIGTGGVTLLVLLSFVLLSNGALYFALGREWPITPSRAGSVQFFTLASIALAPLVVALVTATGLALSRVRN